MQYKTIQNSRATQLIQGKRLYYKVGQVGKLGSKIVQVRLPDDHWLFQEKNKSKVVRDALELYKQLSSELYQLKKTMQEVKELISSGQFIADEPESKQLDTNADPRLMNVLDDFLDI